MKISIILVVISLIIMSYSLACGGNCPAGDCSTCICGRSVKKISIDNYCREYSSWNHECCYCIISRINGGNKNFMKLYDDHYAIGMMPLFYD